MKQTASLLSMLSPDEKKLVHKKAMPTFIKPMLAQLTNDRFSDKNWIFERKLDGERCLIFKKGKNIILKSRNDKLLNESYPEIVDAAKKLSIADCIIDGEIVAFKNKETSFSLLQKRFGVDYAAKKSPSKTLIYYYAFDVMYYDGYLVTHLPLLTRKVILKTVIPHKDSIIRYVDHKDEKGELYFKQACNDTWEGLIAKQKESLYVSKRFSNWLKFKCSNEQEFVIGGYTEPGGSRVNFGALLLGYYKNGKLHYAGKVGTGFNETTLKQLGQKLKKHEIKTNPFTHYDETIKNIHWVKPILVCEVKFSEWTKTNKLRHPSYLGVRLDKSAKEVVQEKV